MPASRQRPKTRSGREAERLRLARAVQEDLLPLPSLALSNLEVAGRFFPSWTLGGDFYDYFLLDGNQAALYLGDVQGKGLESALDALLVSGLLRGVHKAGRAPAEVLAFLNRRLCLRRGPGRFSCLGYAVIELAARQLRFANAGLPFPLLRRHGTVTPVELTGTPAGLFESAVFDERRLALEPGDLVLFYTDGLTDSFRGRRRGPEEDKLKAILKEINAESASVAADALARRLRAKLRDRRRDDVSFVLLRVL